jgi:hypothetical protein
MAFEHFLHHSRLELFVLRLQKMQVILVQDELQTAVENLQDKLTPFCNCSNHTITPCIIPAYNDYRQDKKSGG